jgi:hypothetical protein
LCYENYQINRGYRHSWNIYFHTTPENKSCIYRTNLNILYIIIIHI